MLLGMPNLSGMHHNLLDTHTTNRTRTPYPVIVSQKFIAYALQIDTPSGSKFFDAARDVTPMPISFDKPPDMRFGSVNEKSDASRLWSLKSFLCDVCSFFC